MRDEQYRLNAWIDYHEAHKEQIEAHGVLTAHAAFILGWMAAREQQQGGDFPNSAFAAGYHAYFDREED